MHWGGGGGHGDQVSSEMDGDWAPIHPESVSLNCAGWKLLSVAHGASSTEATGPERRSNRGIRTRGAVVLNPLRPRSFHPFFASAERQKRAGWFLRKFLCVKVGRFPRSTGPSRNPVLLLPVSTERDDSFAFRLLPRSLFSGQSFFFLPKGVKWVFETVGNIPRSTMVRAV